MGLGNCEWVIRKERRKRQEGRRKKEEGRRKKEEGITN
jgi:hypothetical protein